MSLKHILLSKEINLKRLLSVRVHLYDTLENYRDSEEISGFQELTGKAQNFLGWGRYSA